MAGKTHYDVLEVSAGATQEEIKEAYRLLVSMLHPDKFAQGSKQWTRAHEKTQELNEAYAVLKDPQSRAEYDRNLGRQGRATDDTYRRRAEKEASNVKTDRLTKKNGAQLFDALVNVLGQITDDNIRKFVLGNDDDQVRERAKYRDKGNKEDK